MFPVGHLAASYIISQIPSFWGKPLRKGEVVLVVIAGCILDLDLLLAPVLGIDRAYHHFFPTHTPLFALLFAVLMFILLRRRFSPLVMFLASVALFTHLVLDDISYWFHNLGLQEESSVPQIFWLYPFDPRREPLLESIVVGRSGLEIFRSYLTKSPINVFSELILALAAILLFVRTWRLQNATT